MKTLAYVLAASLSAGGCDFAVKHPAPTAAITGGVIALGTCEIQGASQAACGVISGGAAALLGLTAAIAMWIAGDQPEEPQTVDPALLVPDEEKPVHVPTKTEPPPKIDEPPPATNPPATTPPATTPPATTPPATTPPTTTPPVSPPPANPPPPPDAPPSPPTP